MKYSVIVPVFNRPDEVAELLETLTMQSFTDFEVIIVEDGSKEPCETVCKQYEKQLDIKYFMKENSGPGQSRNYGAARSEGEYLLILDSDVVLPAGYIAAIDEELQREPADAFGGPDRAHESFSENQKAQKNYNKNLFNKGGISGGNNKLDKFYPRSFNMGIRRDVYERLGGFSKMRFGEDIDFSIRIFKAGCSCRLFPKAWVWHKRRTDFRKFWRQVYNSGIARINLYKKYPESLKLVHLLPMVFTVGCALLAFLFLLGILLFFILPSGMMQAVGLGLSILALQPLILYSFLIFADATSKNHSAKIGLLSVTSAFIQLIGYGCGFIEAWWKRCVKGKDEFSAYQSNFYK